MKMGLLWRIALALVVLLFAAAYLVPALTNTNIASQESRESAEKSISFLPDSRINLGLDLMGGIHLTLGVEVDKAIQTHLVQLGQDIAQTANKQGLLMAKPRLLPTEQLDFVLMIPEKKQQLEEMLAKEFPMLDITGPTVVGEGNLQYSASLQASEKKRLGDASLDQALTTIRNRIDQFGVAEPDIRKQDGNRIAIQLPGMDSTQRAVSIIGKTAHLEFRMVREGVLPGSIPPAGVEFLPLLTRAATEGNVEPMLAVDKEPVLTGEHITNAQPRPDTENGGYFVSLSFDRRGSEIFSRVTGENLGKRLAIVLDGKIHTAPVIQAKIYDNASITGDFSLADASDLSVVLRAGSLPAPVTVLEERTVGPSLGQESIDKGIMATAVAGAIIVVFMLAYYGISGLIANLMLLLDVGLILAGMAIFGATLTLPGIAGIVLTLGMAIDANVLIFERIREELKAGATVKEAVDQGFSHARRAIIDSNLTSIIATVILYQLGTGPIRGFAVTLTMGIIASMFTAVFVSRIIFDIWTSKPGRKLSI